MLGTWISQIRKAELLDIAKTLDYWAIKKTNRRTIDLYHSPDVIFYDFRSGEEIGFSYPTINIYVSKANLVQRRIHRAGQS